MRPLRILIALLALCSVMQALALVLAQGNATTPTTPPAAVADRAVRSWLDRTPFDPMALSRLPPAEICEQLPQLVSNPPPPEGTTVNFDDRKAYPGSDRARRFTYPVAFPNGQLEILEVRLERQGDTWQSKSVGLPSSAANGPSIPAVLQTPAAAVGFVLLSLLVVYGLVRPSFFRRWLAEGWGYIREYRGLTIGTIVVLYGLFGLGMWTGANLPPTCERAIVTIVEEGVSQLGAAQAYDSGNVARAAVVTLYQNFLMGSVVTTFVPAALTLGTFAYIFNGARFLALGLPFGFALDNSVYTLVTVAILILVELMAYVLVTAGGGMFLLSVARGGLAAFGKGYRKLVMMLPIAFLLLMIGAWYEAAIIILPRLLGGP